MVVVGGGGLAMKLDPFRPINQSKRRQFNQLRPTP